MDKIVAAVIPRTKPCPIREVEVAGLIPIEKIARVLVLIDEEMSIRKAQRDFG